MANLARYNPMSDVISLREAMDRLFEDSFIAPQSPFSSHRDGVDSLVLKRLYRVRNHIELHNLQERRK